jgi:hypothetical protein
VENVSDKAEFRVLIKDGVNYYYFLKEEHHDSETFCFFPDAGFHFTEHRSGEAHIQTKKTKKDLQKEPRLVLLLVQRDNRGVAASDMRLQKI